MSIKLFQNYTISQFYFSSIIYKFELVVSSRSCDWVGTILLCLRGLQSRVFLVFHGLPSLPSVSICFGITSSQIIADLITKTPRFVWPVNIFFHLLF